MNTDEPRPIERRTNPWRELVDVVYERIDTDAHDAAGDRRTPRKWVGRKPTPHSAPRPSRRG